jgi:hypothetical protein
VSFFLIVTGRLHGALSEMPARVVAVQPEAIGATAAMLLAR